MNDAGITRMVGDLRAFSAELLAADRGSTSAQVGRSSQHIGEATRTCALSIVGLIRRALEDQELGFVLSDTKLRTVGMPRGATFFNRPSRWMLHDDRMLPTAWEVPVVDEEPSYAGLRWLAFAAEEAGKFLAKRKARVEEWVQEAKAARVTGGSEWAAKAEAELNEILAQGADDVASVRRVFTAINQAAGKPVRSSSTPPQPFPVRAVWRELRQQLANLRRPRAMLASSLEAGLTEPLPVCDIPALYQRWVGLRIVRAFEQKGWGVAGDPVGALWLGGKLSLAKDDRRAELRIEYRFVHNSDDHLQCVSGESLTPDFCVLFDSTVGPCSWILDATISGNEDIIREKQEKYLRGLRHTRPRFIAGQPVFARPLRSWVAAPLKYASVRLADPDGVLGTLSVDPEALGPSALELWVSDLDFYAAHTAEGVGTARK